MVTIVLLWGPGLALAAVLGLRGWLLAATAPAVTMGVVAIGAPVVSGVGVGWGLGSFLAWTAFVLVLAGVGLLLLRRRGLAWSVPQERWSSTGTLTVVAALAVAAVVAAQVVSAATNGLGTVPQGWDAAFHGNAIRYIAESGKSGNFALGWIERSENPPAAFYPNAYHCFEALVYQLTGASIPHILNTGMLINSALVVPLGAVALIRAAGGSAGFAAASALVSTTFANYPWDLYQWGQLFPYAAGLAMILPFFALVIRWMESGKDRLVVLVAVVGAGLIGVHSSMAFIAAIIGLAYAVQRAVTDPRQWVRHDLPRLGAMAVGIGVLSISYLLGATTMAGRTSAYDWPAVTTPSRALGDGVLLGSDAQWPQWLLAGLVLVGLYLMVRNVVWRWLAACYVIFLVLFVASSAIDFPWATAVTSPWWNDRFRLAAALILPATIAAGFTLQAVARRVQGWTSALVPQLRSRRVATVVLGVVGLLLAYGYFGQSSGYVERNAERMRWTFHSPVLSPLEYEGMREMSKHVKPGELVMNDQFDGSVWSYALSGAWPVNGHYGNTPGPPRKLLDERFNQFAVDPQVAKTIRDLNVKYVVTEEGFMAGLGRVKGLTGLDELPGLKLLYSNKDFQFYEIDWTTLAS